MILAWLHHAYMEHHESSSSIRNIFTSNLLQSVPNSMSTEFHCKQWVTTQDGLDHLELDSASVTEPKDNEVLVKIHTVSLNFRDTEGLPDHASI